NGIYDVVKRVMRPRALRQTRRPRSDRGKSRHSVSSTSAHHNRGSSSHQRDDDEDDATRFDIRRDDHHFVPKKWECRMVGNREVRESLAELPNSSLKPLKIFDKWIADPDLADTISNSWASPQDPLSADLILKNKLKKLSSSNANSLEAGIFLEEIKDTVCLIGCVYKVISKIMASRLSKVISLIIGPNQTAFIAGIGVATDDVVSVASSLGCSHDSIPFIYLGLPVGKRMNLCDRWDIVINHFRERLSSWKANSLSIGRRLTLVKSILGSLPVFFLSLFIAPVKVINLLKAIRCRFFWGFKDSQRGIRWVKWKSILLETNKGGLGIGSILANNIGLLGKWRWCYLTEIDALWGVVINNFYGNDGGFGLNPTLLRFSGVWRYILKATKNIREIVPSFKNLFVLSNVGSNVSFWDEAWCGVNWSWNLPPHGRAIDDLSSLISLIGNLAPSNDDHHTREAQTSGRIERSKEQKKDEKLSYPRYTKLIIDHFLSKNNNIAKRSDANMHSELQDEVLHKLRATTKGEMKYEMKIPEAMLNDKIKMPSGYKKYLEKLKEVVVPKAQP
nr:reverse transcriptase domain, reverse transcriptase zinc-binding domain protein [Tanacetum cinerariifolium]